jgi:subtilisin family serine protease
VLALGAMLASSAWASTIGINVVLKSSPSQTILSDLGKYGRVRDVVPEINAVTMQIDSAQLPKIQGLSYVAAAAPDAERKGGPIDTVAVSDFSNGVSTWDLDAVNVTERGVTPVRRVAYDGSGVYVAVLDTGLVDNWLQYFPQERIATQFGIAFAGGGGEQGTVSSQPNKWEHDQNSHGTHVTSTILGYNLNGASVNGMAPKATVIPVKVLNQNGSGWSSVIARGIVYVADLKTDGKLGSSPVVINMSLGGSRLDPMEKAAIDYAIGKGVLIVASAGNEGAAGVGYPGGYAPVISVAAAGWVGQWQPGADNNPGNWWNADNVPENDIANQFFIADFSSRQLAGKPAQLDVTAPGDLTVGPYQVNGQVSYYYLSGTSMASPHVAGMVALLAQRNAAANKGLTQAQAETAVKAAAVPLPAGCKSVLSGPGGTAQNVCWGGSYDPAGSDADGAGFVTADAVLAQP